MEQRLIKKGGKRLVDICKDDQPVERGGDAGLGNGDGLLLHGLVDRHPVVLTHLVKLINAHHTTISEDHGASLWQKTSFSESLT